jgi:hypothetical protein
MRILKTSVFGGLIAKSCCNQTFIFDDTTAFSSVMNTSSTGPSDTYELPSPLVQTLQREGYPTWGFVLVRTYYESGERWQAFQERLDTLCDAQLDEESGEGLEVIKDQLEFKMIEDPRLQGVSNSEARKCVTYLPACPDAERGTDCEQTFSHCPSHGRCCGWIGLGHPIACR